MAAGKSERLLNLLIMLLVQRHYVSKERIREILYPDSSPDAFEKMFERDKDELRSLGVPIERDPALAHALAAVPVDHEVPRALYGDVARALQRAGSFRPDTRGSSS